MQFFTDRPDKLIENLPEALFLEDLEGNIVDANREACKMLGYEKEELLELKVDDLVPESAPAFLPDQIDETTKSGEPLETVNLRKDGTEVPVELRGKIITLQGKERMLVSVRDISERKRTEQLKKRNRKKYRAIFESATDAIFIMKGKKFIDCNEKTEELFGCSRDEIIGKPPYKFSPEKQPDGRQSKEKVLEKISAALQGEPQTFEWVHCNMKGECFHTYVTLSRYEIDDEKFLMSLVRDITELKEAEEKLRENEQKLRKLHDAVDRFQTCQSEEKLYEATLEVTREVLGFDASMIYVVRDEQLVPVASDQMETSELSVYEKDEALVGATYTNGHTIWGRDVRKVEEARPESPDLRAYMSVPIGELGVFQASSNKKGAFDQVDIELAEILAGHLTEEIKRIRLEGELKEQAIRDPLTGLYNRRYFNETLSKEVGRSERYGYNIAFLMIDINRFKEVNDHYSHQTGDKVLEEVARLLKENVREADTVVRYGGDEFLVMLPETNGDSKYTADRLRNEIDKWNEDSDLLDFTLTLAIGSSHWNTDQGRDVEEALKQADRDMYQAKER